MYHVKDDTQVEKKISRFYLSEHLPVVVFRPNIPHQDDGIRIDPLARLKLFKNSR